MDSALLAILISFLLVLFATILGYTEGNSLDTISDMITRTPQLRNAFAVFVTLMIIAQWHYCSEMMKRWQARHIDLRVIGVAIHLFMCASFLGAFGFAIYSTDVSEQEHLSFAAVSFIGTWGYIAMFCYIAWKANVSVPSALGAFIGFVLATACLVALAPQPSWKHFAEYVFVFSIHWTAACLCITDLPSDFQTEDLQILQFYTTSQPMQPMQPMQRMDSMIEIKSTDGTIYKVVWVDPGCQWAKCNLLGFFEVVINCIKKMEYIQKTKTLIIYGQSKTEKDTVNVDALELSQLRQCALPFELTFI